MNGMFLCGEMANNENKIFQLFGSVAGEMKVDDIPTAPGVDVTELKKGDSDPLEVVVEIPASKSKRGWNYTADSLRNIVDAVNTKTLNGFLGHQRPENVSNEFLPPVTHWVGAKMEGNTAFFRGVVDAAATDLKRWIKSGRIKQVSIFGMPKLQKVSGETNVVGYDPMSIDWTPLDRAGMNTRIVAMSGEMWDLEGQGPSGEMEDKKKGGAGMTPEELLAELKKMMSNKQITVPMIAGEMGWKPEEVAGEVDQEWLKKVTGAVEQMAKVEKALGVSGEMDVVKVAEDAAKALKEQETAGFDKIVGEMMDETIKSDAVKKDIKDENSAIGTLWSYHMQTLSKDLTKEQLAGEMNTFLEKPAVKAIVSAYHTDTPPITGNGSGNQQQQYSGLKTKRVSL